MLKERFWDFINHSKEMLANEVGWPPCDGEKGLENKLLDIESEAAQEIKELLVKAAKDLFGDEFPEMKFEVESHGGKNVETEMPGIYVAYSGNE